jgi:hypothetical protein
MKIVFAHKGRNISVDKIEEYLLKINSKNVENINNSNISDNSKILDNISPFSSYVLCDEIQKVEKFVAECNKVLTDYILDGNKSLFGTKLRYDDSLNFYLVRGEVTHSSFPKGYTFGKIEKGTGKLFSPSGKKPIGNINSEMGGMECVTHDGISYKEFMLS